MLVEQVDFNFGQRNLSGVHWNKTKEYSKKIIALHGWCDNAASFNFLAPQLHAEVFAPDLAGHGRSYHRGELGTYTVWQDLHDIYALVKELGWKNFSLLGHSRGGMVASLFAASFPELVLNFLSIEGLFPIPSETAVFPQQLRAAVEQRFEIDALRKNRYSSFEMAVKAREQGMFRVPHEDALAFAERGIVEKDGKFYWKYDPLLKMPSEVKLSIKHLHILASTIQCPVTLVTGDNSGFDQYDKLVKQLTGSMRFQGRRLSGGHHLHMSENFQAVADIFNNVIA